MKPFITKYFKHFGRYFLINFRFFAKYYLLISAGLILTIALLALLISVSSPQVAKDYLNNAFWTFMNLCGIIMTTSAFSAYGKKNSSIALLTLPVSSLTRFLTILIYAIPLFLVIIIVVYTLAANGIAWVFSSLNFVSNFTFDPFNVTSHCVFSDNWNHIQSYFLVQSLALMAGSFFTRFGFIKTVAILVGLIIVYSIATGLISSNSLDRNFIINLVKVLTSNDHQNNDLLQLMPGITFVWNIVWIFSIPFLWYVGYLRIKEIEA